MRYESGPTIGARIAAARERREISQSALARAVGVTPTAISKLESGETQMLRADHLLRIAAELGADPVALVFGENSSEYQRIAGSWPDARSATFVGLKPRDRRLLSRLIETFIEHCTKTG
ncbi:helix-turn-helix domain-containing protein [Paraburkholderia sp. MM5384-R2]|uniref:helix-turn-helix domain-containing protein n=1 Tax=Paraburkholderia sp. MM5384-R2 TaxID=2723097 RepID=UPI00161F6AF2|nr:helix-turn-helix domain-containing protein [Paraburkholderia sp. MM5384-R2]MBB5496874.1 transcriptional regulator with XRE-family HTH domain [Paraburkholderia sp. MM5384-R2]